MKRSKLGDLCDLFSGGTPSTKVDEYWNGDIPWISSAESGKDFIYDSTVKITQKGVEESATKKAGKGTILIATAGEGKTRGQVSFLENDIYINQSLINISSNNNNEVDNLWLYYYLKNGYDRLRKLSDVTGVRGSLSGTLLKTFIVDFPDIITQRKIANLLRSIDYKIEINNRINDNLQQLSSDIFSYWFLQFEFPNEEEKPYKSSGGKMVYNKELKREIPEGWKNSTLGKSTIMYQPETFDAKTLIPNGKYRVYGAGGFMGFYNSYNHENAETFISCRGSCGNIYRSMPKSLITGNAMIVKTKDISYKHYLYLSLLKIGVKNCITGSVQPQITRDNLNDWKYCIPNISIIEEFNSLINPIFLKIESIVEENQQLVNLRDFLLPMLMNGQVTFK